MQGGRQVIFDRRKGKMLAATRPFALAATILISSVMVQPAAAQFSESYRFLEAVRKADNSKIVEYLETPGVTPINTKDRSTGETALMIVVGKRDQQMTSYLLSRGARPELTDNDGRAPLMLAVERRFYEGAQSLLASKADANQTNSSGETPLIRAVQMRDMEMVRLLMANGADPNRRDRLAGMSAIDYAKAGPTVGGMMDLLASGQKAQPSGAVQGPRL
jgi:ankyrin repeat protein